MTTFDNLRYASNNDRDDTNETYTSYTVRQIIASSYFKIFHRGKTKLTS